MKSRALQIILIKLIVSTVVFSLLYLDMENRKPKKETGNKIPLPKSQKPVPTIKAVNRADFLQNFLFSFDPQQVNFNINTNKSF